jgi:hypothetical protein
MRIQDIKNLNLNWIISDYNLANTWFKKRE